MGSVFFGHSVVPLRVRVDLGVMAMKVKFNFKKALWLEPYHQMKFRVIFRTYSHRKRGAYYLSAEVQSAYSTARVDREIRGKMQLKEYEKK